MRACFVYEGRMLDARLGCAAAIVAATMICPAIAAAQPAGGTGAGAPPATIPSETVKANTATKGSTEISALDSIASFNLVYSLS